MRLRPTRPDDLAFVIDAEADPDNRAFILRWSVARHRAALSDPDVDHRIVESEGLAVGFLILRGIGPERPAPRAVELMRLLITDKGRGLGRAALRAAMQTAATHHAADRVWLDVRRGNGRARALYESEGFARVSGMPGAEAANSDNGDLIVYVATPP